MVVFYFYVAVGNFYPARMLLLTSTHIKEEDSISLWDFNSFSFQIVKTLLGSIENCCVFHAFTKDLFFPNAYFHSCTGWFENLFLTQSLPIELYTKGGTSYKMTLNSDYNRTTSTYIHSLLLGSKPTVKLTSNKSSTIQTPARTYCSRA